MSEYLPYNPGVIPSKEAPSPGDKMLLEVEGLPPIKKKGISCRNPTNPKYDDFVRLRNIATKAMNGRAWYFGPIELNLKMYAEEELHWTKLNDYIGGIMDTLDGSSGMHFTYLPIVYEDDCQVSKATFSSKKSSKISYKLEIKFL